MLNLIINFMFLSIIDTIKNHINKIKINTIGIIGIKKIIKIPQLKTKCRDS